MLTPRSVGLRGGVGEGATVLLKFKVRPSNGHNGLLRWIRWWWLVAWSGPRRRWNARCVICKWSGSGLGGGGGGANYPVYESSVVAGLLVAGGQCCYIAPEQVSDNQPRLDQTATTSNQPSTFYILNGSVSYEFIFNITSSAINLHIWVDQVGGLVKCSLLSCSSFVLQNWRENIISDIFSFG